MENKLIFVSGLPRSGSTIMMNLLGQNPNHHVTPTNAVVGVVGQIQAVWKQFVEFQAQGLENVNRRVANGIGGFIDGFYKQEFKEGKVVFDKSRGWPAYIEEVEYCTGRSQKVIIMVRDMRDICASLEKQFRNRDIEWNYGGDPLRLQQATTVGRIQMWLDPGGAAGNAGNKTRDAIARCAKNLIIVPYKYFMESPIEVMENLHEELELEPFEYDVTNIKQVTKEDDNFFGMNKLHKIKPKIEKQPIETWAEIIPQTLADAINQDWRDINDMAKESCILAGDPVNKEKENQTSEEENE